MPLHLLGKKSWNVYNPENVARVRRDEAEAKAQEEEEERRMQEVDAERRIQLLRGERPSSPPRLPETDDAEQRRSEADIDKSRHRKRRRLAGEDDTDRDLRLAREDFASNNAKRDELVISSRRKARDEHVAITDSAGHINLFTEDMTRNQGEGSKNAEAEAESRKKKRAFEDQYTMRFSNAAGFKESTGQAPWYSAMSSSNDKQESADIMPNTDVWGNKDPMRKEREKARINSNDPLAAMKAGVRGLKNAQRERKEWQQQRLRELEDLRRTQQQQKSAEHRKRRRRRSHSRDSAGSLEGFSLDNSSKKHDDSDPRERERRHSRSRHRHRRRHHHS